MELREGVIPGSSGDIIRLYYSDSKFMVCNVSGESTCRDYQPLSRNIWHRLKITMTRLNSANNFWSLKIEDLATSRVYWNSEANLGDKIKLLSIPRERIQPQIGTIFFGDECLGSGDSFVPGGCDGTGVVYYDQIIAENLDGTGRYSQEIPGDANGDKILNASDFGIWKESYLKVLKNHTVNPSNSTGDFRSDNLIDGLDAATWWNRVGQKIQE